MKSIEGGEGEGAAVLNRFFRESLTDEVCEQRLEGDDNAAVGDLGEFLATKMVKCQDVGQAQCVKPKAS